MKFPSNIIEIESLNPDFMGFIFWNKSVRYYDKTSISISNKIKRVGVFVNESFEEVLRKIKQYDLDYIQLHGEEDKDYCKKIKDYCNEIEKLYLSKEIFNEKEWHDSYIWDLIRIKYEEKYKITNFNISKYFYNNLINKNIDKENFMSKNILSKIPLNKYLIHLKGEKNKIEKKIVTQIDKKNYIFKIDL